MGIVILFGILLLIMMIKLLIDRDWNMLIIFFIVLFLVLETGHHTR